MTTQEKLNLITWEYPLEIISGMTIGRPNPAVTLVCKDYNFKITLDAYRSRIKNQELAFTLFELYLSEGFNK